MIHNGTIRDLLAFLLSTGVFAVLAVLPGYLVGTAGDLLGFRARSVRFRLAAAIPLSLAVLPCICYLAWKYLGFFALLGLLGAACAAGLAALARDLWRKGTAHGWSALRQSLLVPGLCVVAWSAFVGLSLVDLEVPGALYRAYPSIDHVKHTAITDAISRTGVPPQNPLCRPSRATPLFYYYQFHVLCAVVARVCGDLATARAAAQAGCVWAGVALACSTMLWVRLVGPVSARTRPGMFLAVGLLLVTGLDLGGLALYQSMRMFAGGNDWVFPTDLEGWNDQVAAWIGCGLWVPQHLSGLCAALMGFLLLLRESDPDIPQSRRSATIVTAAAAFASTVGMSMWVAFVAAFIGLGWTVISLLLTSRRPRAVPFVLAGLMAAMLAAPFVLELARARETSERPLAFGVKLFGPLHEYFEDTGVSDRGVRQLAYLAVLPINYFFEFGFFLIAAVIYWRERWRTRTFEDGDAFLLLMVVLSLLLCSFMQSILSNNDFGWRGMMFAQFGMLLWSVPVAQSLVRRSAAAVRLGPRDRILLATALMLGIAGTIYDAAMLRFGWNIVFTSHGVELQNEFVRAHASPGKEMLDERQAYEWIRAHLPRDAVVQHNFGTSLAYAPSLHGQRQVVLSDALHSLLFGVSQSAIAAVAEPLAHVFRNITLTPQQAAALSHELNVDYLVVRAADPVWANVDVWDRRAAPVYRNDTVRVYRVTDLLTGPQNGGATNHQSHAAQPQTPPRRDRGVSPAPPPTAPS